jgi:type I restriction enzyme M protein
MVEAYREFKNEDGFSKVIDIEKIKENDYNLNVTLYVLPEEETEEIDVTKEWEELRKLEVELVEVEMRIEGYIRELQSAA